MMGFGSKGENAVFLENFFFGRAISTRVAGRMTKPPDVDNNRSQEESSFVRDAGAKRLRQGAFMHRLHVESSKHDHPTLVRNLCHHHIPPRLRDNNP